MKILINHTDIYIGGAEIELRSLADYMSAKGFDITVAAMPSNMDLFRSAFSPKVKCIRARLVKCTHKNRFIRILHAIIRKIYRCLIVTYLNTQKYDVSIAFIEGLPSIDALQVKAKSYLAWIHCDLRHFNAQQYIQSCFSSIAEEKMIYQKYDKVVCVSETAKTGFIETIGDTGNLCVKYNPINWIDIQKKSKEPCPAVKNNNRSLIVTIGTLGTVKNYGTLLEAVNLLKDKVPFDVWMIGKGGSEEEKLKQYAKENKLNNVYFLGYQKNPYPYLLQADLFVSTSISESYGLAVQEALILGKPVIAVRCEGIEEAFDECFGRLINNSAQELADNIKSLLECPSELHAYSKAIKENYSTDSLYEERMDKICQLIK